MCKFYKFRGNIGIGTKEERKLFERDINMVLNGEIWCSKLNDLNDPFEGEYKMDLFNKNLDLATNFMSFLGLKNKSDDTNKRFSSAVRNIFELTLERSGIYSLTTNHTNDLMWSHYANSHKGFCIEYEFDNLEILEIKYDKFTPSHLNYFEKVNYSNTPFNLQNINVKTNDIIKFLFHKNDKWKYEDEWRIVTFISGKHSYNSKCVKSIIFGIKTSEEVINLVKEKLKPLNIEFYKMKKIDSYILGKEKI